MTKSKPLPLNTIEALFAERKREETVESSIVNRVDYVIKTLMKAFELELDNWNYSGDGEYDSLDNSLGIVYKKTLNETFNYCPSFKSSSVNPYDNENNYKIILTTKNGKTKIYDILYSFPSKWLFEDFEEELSEGIKRYQEFQKYNIDKENKLKEKHNLLVQAAKSKLTKEELSALKEELK